MSQVFPNSRTFQIGDVNATDTVFVAGRLLRTGMMNGRIKNKGPAAFTFSIAMSNDNGINDAWAAITFLVTTGVAGSGGPAGVQESSLSVVPGGEVDFVIDKAAKKFIKFSASPQPGSVGQMTLYYNKNVFVEVQGPDIALPATIESDFDVR